MDKMPEPTTEEIREFSRLFSKNLDENNTAKPENKLSAQAIYEKTLIEFENKKALPIEGQIEMDM